MDFWRQRGFLLGEDLPEKVGCRKESYFLLEFIYVDIARDFVGVVFHDLHGAKGFHNNWNSCFDPPHSLKLLWGRGV